MDSESQPGTPAADGDIEDRTEKRDIRNVPKGILKEFIEMYRAHPALWQIKNKELYNNRNLKNKGYIELKIWKKYDPGADQKSVKLKIQSLRGSFRKELKKVQKSERSGSGVEDIYRSQLWDFKFLSFLIEHELSTDSIDNIEPMSELSPISEVEDTEPITTEINTDSPQASSSNSTNVNKRRISEIGSLSTNRKKKSNEEQEKRMFMAKCTHALEYKPGEADALGIYISTKLEKVTNAEQRMYAEGLLTKVLNKAIMGKLSEYTDVIDNKPPQYYPSNISYVSTVPSPFVFPTESNSATCTTFITESIADPVSAELKEYFTNMQS